MTDVEYLEVEDLLALTRRLHVGPVRDIGLLEAACARPSAAALGEEAYPTLELKAAALLHSIARNHALLDGNQGLAWLAAVVFLDLNGRAVGLSDDEAFALVMDTAGGQIDVAEIANRLSSQQERG